jgi:hypothetical protein
MQFYPRVLIEIAIIFFDEEITLLNKGLKYNLSHKSLTHKCILTIKMICYTE